MNDTNINECNRYSYCFLFYISEILFKGHEDSPKFLLTSEVKKLGIDNSEMTYVGTEDDNDYYAANISNKDEIQGYFSKKLRQMYGEVDENIYLLALRALHFINWLNKNKYCSCCGKEVRIEEKKTYIECLNCGHVMYPFINPCIIVAILKENSFSTFTTFYT